MAIVAARPNYREPMNDFALWSSEDAAGLIAVPTENDDKYTRGVLGVITGSSQYPGAAVLGVEAALRTGVGMVRYLGPGRATRLVLARRPEAVAVSGRVQAWLIGSGMDRAGRSRKSLRLMEEAVSEGLPVILDGGALDLHSLSAGATVITPHFRELARLIGEDVAVIASDPAAAALHAADSLGVTVLLKGHISYIAGPEGTTLSARSAPNWLATAGAGDALGGILGALMATHASLIDEDTAALPRLAATAAVLHGLAAQRASRGGPFTILDLAAELPDTIAGLLSS